MWLSGLSFLIVSHHSPKFGVHGPYENGDITLFILPRDHDIEESHDFVGGVLSFKVTTLLSLGYIGLVKMGILRFSFVIWPRHRRVTWLCGWGLFILSHHPAKFGVHRPCRTQNNNVINIRSNSSANCNSSAEVPMPRFTNDQTRALRNICEHQRQIFLQ